MQLFGYQLLLTLFEEHNSDPYLCVDDRSYSATGDGQVHENPEWEKARQALASINKTQNPAKNSQASRPATEVDPFLFTHLLVSSLSEVIKSGKSNSGHGLLKRYMSTCYL